MSDDKVKDSVAVDLAPVPPPAPKYGSASILIVVSAYFIVSIALVFFNKIIMQDDQFPFPLTVSWYQFFVALICIAVLGWLGRGPFPQLSFIPPLEFDIPTAIKVTPVTSIFVGMIVFNNLCLQYVEVSFYQIARSLTSVFSIIFSYIILGESTSFNAMGTCMIVMVGFGLGSWGEIRFTWLGLSFGLISSLFVALYAIYVKKVMNILHGDHWLLMNYNTILSLIFLLPFLFFTGEIQDISVHPALFDQNNWFVNTLAGLLGFSINIIIFLQIKLTSPLTNNMAGQVKAAVQTVLAIYIFNNPVSTMNAIGIFLVIAGSAMYSYIRFLEMQKK